MCAHVGCLRVPGVGAPCPPVADKSVFSRSRPQRSPPAGNGVDSPYGASELFSHTGEMTRLFAPRPLLEREAFDGEAEGEGVYFPEAPENDHAF